MNVDRPLQVLSLCSGVGMLDEGVALGLRYLGRDSRVVGYCERDSYATACLLARMEESSLEPAPVFCGNLEDLDAGSLRGFVDLLCAGFPCQPWSNAGQRAGTEDERWLWPAIARIIRDAEPAMVFLENVSGLVSGGGLHFVLDDLAEMRFDAEWCHFSAADVGASHRRERFFLLAFSDGGRRRILRQSSGSNRFAYGGNASLDDANGDGQGEPWEPREKERPQQWRGSESSGRCEPLGDTQRDGGRIDEPGRGPDRGSAAWRASPAVCGNGPAFAPGPDAAIWPDVLRDYPHLAPAVEPGVCVLADGLALVVDASRADQLRCGGNGVVALQAAAAFVGLMRRSKT